MIKPRRTFGLILVTILLLSGLVLFFSRSTIRISDYRMASTLLPGDRVSIAYKRGFMRQAMVVYRNPTLVDIPLQKRKIDVSRIACLPGDTLVYFNKQLFVNRDTIKEPATVRHEYRIVHKLSGLPDSLMGKYDIQPPIVVAEIGIYDYSLPPFVAQIIEKIEGVQNVRETHHMIGDASMDYYPASPFSFWNRDQYGPLIIPFKGQTIEVTVQTIDLYRDIIEKYEGNEVIVDFRGVFINGELAGEYIIKRNYYFVIDDNRDWPNDSRKIGFIPEDHLIGTVKRIIWSSDLSKKDGPRIRLNRWFKKAE